MKLHFVSRRAMLALGAAAIALAACGGEDYADTSPAPPAAAETISAVLTGDQEVPVRVESGATGVASLSLDRSTRTLRGTVTVDGVVPTVAHIHAGAAGSAGAIVLPLTVSANQISLPATVLSQAQLDSLDAGELYVNIHSAAQPGGEIRGQLGREVFTARLTGAQETTPVVSSAVGSGLVVLNPKTLALSGGVELTGITATAAHIHSGAFGSNGAVLFGLTDHGGHGHFTVPDNTVLTPAQAGALRAGGLYFNAHSAQHPGGEIRGQIGRRVLIASASGAQEVPANLSAASGRAFVVLDPATRRVEGNFTVTDMTATVAHIHAALAGSNGGIALGLTETAAGSGVWAVPANTTLTAVQAQALLTGGLYVNAHSTNFPAGEIRGQLGREVFNAQLSGAQETTPVVTAANGSGFLVLDPETLAVEGEVEVVGMTATAAHVHSGAFGTNGAVLLTLEDHGGHGHFTVPAFTTLSGIQVNSLREGQLYFNAHSALHTGGEIRGQIGRRVLLAAATGVQEVPGNTSAANGRGFVTFDPTSRRIEGRIALTGMTATIAHIHQAAAGSNGSVALALTETAAGNGVWTLAAGTTLTAVQAQALLADGMYYNAHSAAFAAGEIRGQLELE